MYVSGEAGPSEATATTPSPIPSPSLSPDGDPPKTSSLRRSLSDRLAPGAKPTLRPKKDQLDCADLFNDTMRLTLRVPRATSHGIFPEANAPKQRPKEPPPPPPPPTTIPVLPAIPPRQLFPNRRKSDVDKVEIVISDDWPSRDKQRRHSSVQVHNSVGTVVSITPNMTRVTDPVTKCDSQESFPNRKTSIFINSESNLRFKSPIPVSNKIRISVGQPPPDPDPSEVTCSSSPFTTSQTVIPITPDNFCSRVEIRPSEPESSPQDCPQNCPQESRQDCPQECVVVVKDVQEHCPTAKDEINVLILDPVEAVKRNLVPHVCVRGSHDDEDYPKIDKPSTEEIMAVTEIREVIGEKIIDIPCVKESSCFKEDKPDAHEENNTYETITDPIYESISEVPPPLPLSPPPLSTGSRSIFEGASKADILSYLADARDRVVPEETFVSESGGGGCPPDAADYLEERSPARHSREPSFDLADLSSQVSQISHTSESSDDSANSSASPTTESPRDSFKVSRLQVPFLFV